VGYCGVDVLDARDALLDEVHRLAPQRRRHAIRHVARHLLSQDDRMPAEPPVETDSARDHLFILADDLDQRHEVRRIERMRADVPASMHAVDDETAAQQRRRASGDDDLGWRDAIDTGEQRTFRILVLRRVLLHEVRTIDCALEFSREIEPPLAGVAESAQRLARPLDEFAKVRFGAGRRIGCLHMQAVRDEQRRPARADGSAADYGDRRGRFVGRHQAPPDAAAWTGVCRRSRRIAHTNSRPTVETPNPYQVGKADSSAIASNTAALSRRESKKRAPPKNIAKAMVNTVPETIASTKSSALPVASMPGYAMNMNGMT